MPQPFTFHSYNAEGAPVAMQARAFASEAAAADHAGEVLAEHLSAAYVVVCEGDREILTLHREPVG